MTTMIRHFKGASLAAVFALAVSAAASAGERSADGSAAPPTPPSRADVTRLRGLGSATVLPDGSLRVRGKLAGQGTLPADHVILEGEIAPGDSPGCITGSNITLGASARLIIEIGGPTPCTEHDRISVQNHLSVNGATFDLRLIDGYVPAAGDSFTVLTWSSVSGSFAAVDLAHAGLADGLAWDTSELLVTGRIVVVAAVAANPVPVPLPWLSHLALGLILTFVTLAYGRPALRGTRGAGFRGPR